MIPIVTMCEAILIHGCICTFVSQFQISSHQLVTWIISIFCPVSSAFWMTLTNVWWVLAGCLFDPFKVLGSKLNVSERVNNHTSLKITSAAKLPKPGKLWETRCLISKQTQIRVKDHKTLNYKGGFSHTVYTQDFNWTMCSCSLSVSVKTRGNGQGRLMHHCSDIYRSYSCLEGGR